MHEECESMNSGKTDKWLLWHTLKLAYP